MPITQIVDIVPIRGCCVQYQTVDLSALDASLQNCFKMTSKFLFEGIWMDSHLTPLENVCFARDEFLVKDDDVIIVGYPRSGTHWMIEILCLIYYNGDPSLVQSVPNYVRSPWIEDNHFQENIKKQDGSRLMTSHLPVQLFPKSYFTSNAKIIYIIRNPRDIVTSWYHLLKGELRQKQPKHFDEFLDDFVQGEQNVCFARDEFLVKDDDVILVSYPRSGIIFMGISPGEEGTK
nr:bile salt sulfotransferase-like [Microcebus murinus]